LGEKIMTSIDIYWSLLLKIFLSKYTFIALTLIAFTFIHFKKYKEEAFNWLYILNTILPWVYLLVIIQYFKYFFWAWYGQNPYEWYAFKDDNNYGLDRYIIIFTLTIAANCIFFIKKTRINRLITAMVLIVDNAGFLLTIIQDRFRDYHPSVWFTNRTETISEGTVLWFFFLAVILLLYWFFWKRKKLPYPSLILD
jgi:hypothetical protein